MTDFKDLLNHIFSQNEPFKAKALGIETTDLKPLYEMALKCACGGEVEPKAHPYVRSIFDALAGRQGEGYYFEPKELSITDFNFPTKDTIKSTYNALDGFTNELEQIKNFQGRAYADTCLSLLEKYFSYTPCGIAGLEDVSLYDHIKSVMGLMVCLQASEDKEKPVLLVGGDISGIQSFIYDIISTYASKNLKGRSFYLQLLVDAVIERLLGSLDLCNANIVYASGGGFYLLAPNTNKVKTILDNQIKDISDNQIKDISEKIYETHKTALHLAIAHVEVQEKAFENGLEQDGKLVWDTLIEEINAIHKRKFINLDAFDSFFEPFEVGGTQERDVVTNEEFTEEEIKETSCHVEFLEKDDKGKPIGKPVKYATHQQIELGTKLKNVKYIIQSNKELKYFGDTFDICNLGIHYYFLDDDSDTFLEKFKNYTKSDLKIISLNDINFLNKKLLKQKITFSSSLYGGNDYPIFENIKETKTFSELAGQRELERVKEYGKKYTDLMPEISLKRLGILRMDVDGLGTIFGEKGFKNQKRTFSKYATLSRNLDLFFKGYLNTIWSKNESFKQNSQIIYAGGDDLFIVGRWDILIDFAEKIQKDFEKWTCGNVELGISGGLAIVPPKFPISQGAGKADRLEKNSKHHTCNDFKKNSLDFFERPLHWKDEFRIVKELKTSLLAFVGQTDNKSILMRIQAIHAQRQEQISKNQTHSWRWLLAYDLGRFEERLKKDQQMQKNYINELKTCIFTNCYAGKFIKNYSSSYDFLDLLALASRWAEMAYRMK